MTTSTQTLKLSIGRFESPIGTIVLIHDQQQHLRALDFQDYDSRMQRLLRLHYGQAGAGFSLQDETAPRSTLLALERYFAGELCALQAIPTATAGTPFQRSVWSALREIPAGTTLSYGTLAQRLGSPQAVRAVGMANGSNPIGIVVPCHRVIGADSSLTGYGGGIERKRWLLSHEGIGFRSERHVA